jgi:hypothetical protein
LFILFCIIFSSIPSLNIFLIKNHASLFFLGLPLMVSPWSHVSGHRSERLAQVDFDLILKHFLSNICLASIFFRFPNYGVIPTSCFMSCVWFVDPSWLLGSLEAFCFVIFFIYLSIISAKVYSLHFKCGLSFLKLFNPVNSMTRVSDFL